MFHIVVFDKTNEVEVVPSVWIKNGECMWPPNKSHITKAVNRKRVLEMIGSPIRPELISHHLATRKQDINYL
ncbi:serine/arginine repetitive matrix protein 2-like [Tachysurus ichikawai]